MSWGVITDVAAPAEVYDAMHARLLDLTGGRADGLLVHLARATDTGFQIVDVWESKDDYERYQAVLGPMLAEMSGPDGPQGAAPVATEFDARLSCRCRTAHAGSIAAPPTKSATYGRHRRGHRDWGTAQSWRRTSAAERRPCWWSGRGTPS